MQLNPRGDALGFAERTKKNLEYIEKANKEGAGVHPITQIANSLLGLIVFPREQILIDELKRMRLAYLRGWPRWRVTKGKSKTLGEVVSNLRHAVAHGNITYMSLDPDTHNPDEVTIQVENYVPGTKEKGELPIWVAEIRASDLKEFCYKFIQLIDDTIG